MSYRLIAKLRTFSFRWNLQRIDSVFFVERSDIREFKKALGI